MPPLGGGFWGGVKVVSGYVGGETCVCLLSSFLLFNTNYVRYLMAFGCVFFMRVLMLVFEILRLASLLMECSCIATLTLVVMVMRGLVCQPWFCMVLINGSYLLRLCQRAWSRNLSWQYVNSMSWIVRLEEGDIGGCVWCGAPIMHRISGFSLAWHWHVVCVHVHLRSHSGIVWLGDVLLKRHALVNVKNRVFLLACKVLVMRCIALLCLAILRPCMLIRGGAMCLYHCDDIVYNWAFGVWRARPKTKYTIHALTYQCFWEKFECNMKN